jgi:outer membrane receptor protein involved in Fe transport
MYLFNAETRRRREINLYQLTLRLRVSALKSFLFGLLFICCSSVAARAQTISGRVTDERNAPIANSAVSLLQAQNVISQTTTDSTGNFSLETKGANSLTLRVSASNFATVEKPLSELSQPIQIVLQPADVQADVTISITRTETRLAETPASVVVLNRQTIEQSAAQTVDDALRQVPGFTLFRRSSSKTSNPTTQGANLRGLSGSGASRTAVQLDGVSLNDAFGGWTYWTRIPRVAVEQVEVLRGGASSTYGTAALSGAVNILTVQPSNKPILRFETSAGTQETFDGSVYAAAGKSGWFGSIAAESFQSAGYIPVAEEERGTADSKANSRHNSLFVNAARSFSKTSRVFVRGNLFAERRDSGTRLQNNRTYFRQIVAGGDFSSQTFGNFSLRSFVEAQVYDQSFSAVSADRNTETLSRLQRVPSQAVGANLFWARSFNAHTVSAGIEARQVRGFSDETIFVANRASSLTGSGGREFSFGFFAQDFWRVTDKLNLNFGGRVDRWSNENALSTTRNLASGLSVATVFPNRIETAFSPRVAAIYQLNDNLSVTGSAGQSFRAPTLNELYRAFRVGNVLTLANENLRAERATNGEIGLRSSFFQNKLNLRGTAYLAEVSRPVVNVTLSVAPNLITRQRQNLGRTRSRGFEFDAEFSPSRDWQISAGYLFVDARIVDFPASADLVGKQLPQIPRQQLTFQTFYRPPKPFSIGLQGRISAAQFEDDQNTLRLRPFFTLDVFAAVRPTKRLEIFLAVENIFNNRYDIGLTPVRTVAAPAFVRAGVRFR